MTRNTRARAHNLRARRRFSALHTRTTIYKWKYTKMHTQTCIMCIICIIVLYTPWHYPLIMRGERRAWSSRGTLPVFHISYDNTVKWEGWISRDHTPTTLHTICFMVYIYIYIYIDPKCVIFSLTFYYFLYITHTTHTHTDIFFFYVRF